jgi:hypothetical protein
MTKKAFTTPFVLPFDCYIFGTVCLLKTNYGDSLCDFFKSANQKQELPVAAMFVNESGRNEQSL